METTNRHSIILYTPRGNAGRIKFKIPYLLKAEREAFKKLDGTFYHYNQKLWSIVNTEDNLKRVQQLFGSKLMVENEVTPAKIPQFIPSEKI